MKIAILVLLTTLFFTFLNNNSPFYMNLAMILMIASMASWAMWLTNKWIFSILIIFYLGGMMILFAYIVSLSKSKHIYFKYPFMVWLPISILFLLMPETNQSSINFFFKAYYLSNWQYIFFLSLVLLGLLIIINKICLPYFGPMAYKQND